MDAGYRRMRVSVTLDALGQGARESQALSSSRRNCKQLLDALAEASDQLIERAECRSAVAALAHNRDCGGRVAFGGPHGIEMLQVEA